MRRRHGSPPPTPADLIARHRIARVLEPLTPDARQRVLRAMAAPYANVALVQKTVDAVVGAPVPDDLQVVAFEKALELVSREAEVAAAGGEAMSEAQIRTQIRAEMGAFGLGRIVR